MGAYCGSLGPENAQLPGHLDLWTRSPLVIDSGCQCWPTRNEGLDHQQTNKARTREQVLPLKPAERDSTPHGRAPPFHRAGLRAEIKRQVGTVHSCETNSRIPRSISSGHKLIKQPHRSFPACNHSELRRGFCKATICAAMA